VLQLVKHPKRWQLKTGHAKHAKRLLRSTTWASTTSNFSSSIDAPLLEDHLCVRLCCKNCGGVKRCTLPPHSSHKYRLRCTLFPPSNVCSFPATSLPTAMPTCSNLSTFSTQPCSSLSLLLDLPTLPPRRSSRFSSSSRASASAPRSPSD
jgi:hypothetical protein